MKTFFFIKFEKTKIFRYGKTLYYYNKSLPALTLKIKHLSYTTNHTIKQQQNHWKKHGKYGE